MNGALAPGQSQEGVNFLKEYALTGLRASLLFSIFQAEFLVRYFLTYRKAISCVTSPLPFTLHMAPTASCFVRL